MYFLLDVTVSVPAMMSVGEGSDSLKVCAALLSIDDIERDFVVTLVTSDGTGKILSLNTS